jgi:DNA-binding IclR family transcriptional regulator
MDVSRSVGGIYRVQVIDRAAAIIQVLADAPADLAPADIAQRLRLHKSTIHRLLTVLERHRFIRKNAGDGKYALGLKLFELGNRAAKGLTLREHAHPFLARLVRETSETAHVGVLDEGDMVSIANVESPRAVQMRSAVGRRTPAHCSAIGKAVLASLLPSALDVFVARRPLSALTGKTLVTRAALMTDLQRIRVRGYAIDDEEIERGLRCVGAPVRDHTGLVIGAVSVSGPAFRIPKTRIPALGAAVMAVARELSAELGLGAAPLGSSVAVVKSSANLR